MPPLNERKATGGGEGGGALATGGALGRLIRAVETFPGLRAVELTRTVPGGRAYVRTSHRVGQGRSWVEHWLVKGAGHAWSGGSRAGRFVDPGGPDASAQMLRFFLSHRTTRKTRAAPPT